MPCKMTLPLTPTRYYLDYSFHNDVLDVYLGCLPMSELPSAYEELVNIMPANITLLKR